MKIHFDARFIRPGNQDGISRFSSELARALSKKTELVAIISDLRQLEQLPSGVEFLKLNDPTDFLSELLLARKLNQLGAEVVFSPMQTTGSLGKKFKLVLTLHDLIYYQYRKAPQHLPLLIRIAWRLFHLGYAPQRFLLNRANLVVTVSNTSREQIIGAKLTRRPVKVVYNAAADGSTLEKSDKSIEPKTNRLIYMGSFMPYKNVELLVRALNHLPNYELVLLSRITETRKSELRSLLNSSAGNSSGKLIFRNGVSEAEYHLELSQAFALVSASKAEGFGIPVVEAMSRGLPTIVSDLPIFREVGGDASRYFDPDQPTSLVNQIRELEDASNWSKASEQGLKQAAKFSWDRSAQALLDAISEL